MSIGISTGAAIALAGGLGAAGSVAGAAIGASGASNAASTQANAATNAAELQKQTTEEELALQKSEFDTQQQNIAPWLQAGQFGLGQLMAGIQNGTLTTPYSGTFTPPTLEEARNTPGYQFTQQAGTQAIENAASASGGAFTGAEVKNLDVFNQGLADTTYQQVFNNALNTFNTNFNAYNTSQTNQFNRLAALSGIGQNAANTLGTLGQQNVNAQTGALQSGASNITNLLTSAAAAQAAGIVGSSNAWSSGIGGLGNSLTSYLTLQNLMGGNYGAAPPIPESYTQPLPYVGAPAGYVTPDAGPGI